MTRRPQTSNRLLYGLGLTLAAFTFVLVTTGGAVTSYNAGLAVPDWPASFGRWLLLPAAIWSDLAVFLEHNHRLTGAAAGLLAILTAGLVARRFGLRHPMTYAALAIPVLFAIQGVLGGLRVTEKSIGLAIVHGVSGQLVLAFVVAFMVMLGWRRTRHEAAGVPIGRTTRMLTLALLLLFVVQLTLGAITRHTHSASAIPDAPFVFGRLVPPLDQDAVAAGFHAFGGDTWTRFVEEPALSIDAADLGVTPGLLDQAVRVPAEPASVALVWNQYVHRVTGMLVLPVALLVVQYRLAREHPLLTGLRAPMLTLLALFIVQVMLGLSVIWSKEHPHVATAHQAVGALMLAMATALAVRAHLVRRPAEAPDPVTPARATPAGRRLQVLEGELV